MRRTIQAILGLTAATWLTWVHADVTVLAVRLGASVAAAKAAGGTIKSDVASVTIGGMKLKSATLIDPDGNVLELMELPKGVSHLRHP